MGKINSLAEGDLIIIQSHNSWTLCLSTAAQLPALRECPIPELAIYTDPDYNNIFKCLEGKAGLIVYVAKNRLDQAMGYRVLIEGHEMFCKSKVAQKYFKLTENQGDESR